MTATKFALMNSASMNSAPNDASNDFPRQSLEPSDLGIVGKVMFVTHFTAAIVVVFALGRSLAFGHQRHRPSGISGP